VSTAKLLHAFACGIPITLCRKAFYEDNDAPPQFGVPDFFEGFNERLAILPHPAGGVTKTMLAPMHAI